MTNFTVESKSQLAKLMATENLTIQHSKIQTAKFDPKNRVLYLPIWQNMTGYLYDLLTGHEVGHALYTPAEGWHDAVTDAAKGKNFKSFLNVVEDARIEKKVQRKYPGLKLSFAKAYADLVARDFFGLEGRDINDMAFINRLNLFTKSQYTMKIEFNQEEYALVEKVKSVESWSDVVRVAEEIYAYSKDEQSEMENNLDEINNLQDFDFDEDEDGQEPDSELESGSNDEEGSGDDEGEGQGDGEESEEEGEEEETLKPKSDKYNREKDSNESDFDQFSPKCETDDNYRKNESLLLDEQSKDYVYVSFPKANLKNIVTPYKRVHELMEESWDQQLAANYFDANFVQELMREFKTKNEKYVSLLAKEFEMKKAAKSFAKAKISDTGDIDINKIASYQFDDNIFRKVMTIPKGKSHGLILLLDYSGSMSQNMAGSIEQILILALFCRKVNIPFHVYSFSDSTHVMNLDRAKEDKTGVFEQFSNDSGEICMKSVLLREYLNSKMSNAEFTKCLKNMLLLKAGYEGPRISNRVYRPSSESLSNTPLTQAICAMKEVMTNFRKVNNLDLSSLVIVHDGDADSIRTYKPQLPTDQSLAYGGLSFDTYSTNIVITDPKIKYQFKVTAEDGRYGNYMLRATLDWFRKSTNSKVFGFYITPASGRNLQHVLWDKYVGEDGKTVHQTYAWHKAKELARELKTNKALVSNNAGYNKFFFILGGKDLATDNDEIEIEGKVTASKLKTAFMKFNKKRQVNRVIVSKFIEGIAA